MTAQFAGNMPSGKTLHGVTYTDGQGREYAVSLTVDWDHIAALVRRASQSARKASVGGPVRVRILTVIGKPEVSS